VTAAAVRQVRASAWVFLPQAVARLSALFVFAVAANRLSAEDVGILAIATAVTAASFARSRDRGQAARGADRGRVPRVPCADGQVLRHRRRTAVGLLLGSRRS
jgi:hypothetical protein